MSEVGCIYKHTNLIHEGWSYIGQTIYDINTRWKNGRGYDKCLVFKHAIDKYGWDNFSHEIIEDNVPIDKLDERESYWIEFYHTYVGDPECKGYNMTKGGNVGRGRICSEETKLKTSKALIGHEVSENTIRKILETKSKWTDEQKENVRKKLSESHKGNVPAMKGKHHSDETKKKLSQYHHGFKPIMCVETGTKYNSIKEAAEVLDVSPSSISDRTNHPEKFKSGYHFIRIDEHD